ncbi:MarR family winged helix-turn-helix transcriptional regulator [Streptomyces sp. SPB074]|uniref:MarR family winged helix-turn-helix transcriptional regulator n=1 Tax=Streptomyces sp. (strain SPB074) TaxID=465543 RepID=UPI00017FEE17|nr:MarR family transcriptional regulator [Streptomyces sp. SPB074]EDY46203.1 MarR-family regulatory protein [Streptomyces sp. SPB074]
MSKSAPEPTPGYLVWRLANKWRVAVDRAVAPLGLTHAQYVVLASLHGMGRSGERPSQRRLADHIGLEALYVSKLARALESAGLLARTRDPHDPRAVQLALTEEGGEVARRAIDLVRDLHEQLLAPLGGPGSARTLALTNELTTLLRTPLAPPVPDDQATRGAPHDHRDARRQPS